MSIDQSNPWNPNDEASTNQKPSELDPRRHDHGDQWDESKNERRVSELDPRLRQMEPENERFSDRYGFNGPVRGSPNDDRYGERSYEYGRERSRLDRDRRENRDRDDRFDNGPYDDGPNRYDHELDRNRPGEPDHDRYGMSDRRYDSYNASPRGSNRDSQQRDHYPSNNSHSPRDHYSGNSSPHRYESAGITYFCES